MGTPNRDPECDLTGCFSRVIVDEGHILKGGLLFDRAASIVGLNPRYRQIYSASLLANRITDYGGVADFMQTAKSIAAYKRVNSQGRNPFGFEDSDAVLARHTKKAFEKYIRPGLDAMGTMNKEAMGKEKEANRCLKMIFENNLLRRLPSSRVPSAVGIYRNWTPKETNPNGVIGFDIKDAFYITVGVEYKQDDYVEFQTKAKLLHWELYQDWMPQRDGTAIIPQDSRMLRDLCLLSNSTYFSRPLNENAPNREPIAGTNHSRLERLRRERNRCQAEVMKCRAELAKGRSVELEERLQKYESLAELRFSQYLDLAQEDAYEWEEMAQYVGTRAEPGDLQTVREYRDQFNQTPYI